MQAVSLLESGSHTNAPLTLRWFFCRREYLVCMKRRAYLTAICSTGVITMADCSTVAGGQTLSEPTVKNDADGRRALIFTQEDEEIGHFGVDGHVESGLIDLSTEIWHRDGTDVEAITLRLWMPQIAQESPAEVAVVSPVEGDSSPPPSVTLYTPERELGTVIEITDLDDLADETISTLNVLVKPGSKTATALTIHATIELTDSGLLGSDYTLDGRLQVEYPELNDQ